MTFYWWIPDPTFLGLPLWYAFFAGRESGLEGAMSVLGSHVSEGKLFRATRGGRSNAHGRGNPSLFKSLASKPVFQCQAGQEWQEATCVKLSTWVIVHDLV